MTRGEMLAKLETLLLRVRARSAQPRAAPRQPAPVFDVAHADGAIAPEPMAGFAVDGLPSHVTPPAVVPSVALSEEALPANERFDSRERLVAAQSLAPEPETRALGESAAPPAAEGWSERPAGADAVSVAPADASQGASRDVVEIEVVGEEESGEERDEEAPASSRRPVVAHGAEGHLSQMAFGTEEPPPLHTPPPESGQLPASPAEFDPDVTGVRTAAPLAAPPPPREFAAEVTRPHMAPSDGVAEVIARAQRFSPSSFVALLDESLKL